MNWVYIMQWGISEAEVDFCKKEEVSKKKTCVKVLCALQFLYFCEY